jgi:hypothetical protein
MSTTTTRLGLVKPAGTEAYDVNVVNANSDKVDAAMPLSVTSTTRPSSPYAGQVIHESDTSEILVRNAANSAWLTVGVSTATAGRIARRDASGRLAVATPAATGDAATKGYVDAVQNVPVCTVTRNTSQSATTATWTTISWSAEREDTDAMWAVSPNPTRVTVTKAGIYALNFQGSFDASTAGTTRGSRLVKNGSATPLPGTELLHPLPSGSTRLPPVHTSTVERLAVNDYIEVMVYQDSGGALGFGGTTKYEMIFSAVFIRP